MEIHFLPPEAKKLLLSLSKSDFFKISLSLDKVQSMKIELNSLIEWSTLLLIIGGLIYAAIVIKNEKSVFLNNLKIYHLKHFTFKIPSWWGLEKDVVSPLRSSFIRKDTRYDWRAIFEWLPLKSSEIGLSGQDIFIQIIKKKNILFDERDSIVHETTLTNINKSYIETVRVEGMATEDGTERIYYDGFIILDKKSKGYLFCESKSSILNGMIEGPYFEEAIKSIELKNY
jgi:hypothetical protein